MFARDPSGVFGCEKDCNRPDIIRVTTAPERGLRDYVSDEVASYHTCSMYAFCFDITRVDRVHPDAFWTELFRQDTGYDVNGAFCRGVDASVWHRYSRGD